MELVGFAGMTAGGILIGTWGGFKSRIRTLIVGMFYWGEQGVVILNDAAAVVDVSGN